MRESYTSFINMDKKRKKKLVKAIDVLRAEYEDESNKSDLETSYILNLILEVEQAIYLAWHLKDTYKKDGLRGLSGHDEGVFDCIKTLKDLCHLTNTPMLAHTHHVSKKALYLESLFRFIYSRSWTHDEAIIEKFRIYLEELPVILGPNFLHIEKTTQDAVSSNFLDTELFTKSSKIRWRITLGGFEVNLNKNASIYESREGFYKLVVEEGIKHKEAKNQFPSEKKLKELNDDKKIKISKVKDSKGNIYSFNSMYSSEIYRQYNVLNKVVSEKTIDAKLNEKRRVPELTISIKDFYEFSENVLDKKQPDKNWSQRLKKINFLDVENEFKISDIIKINDIAHWVGLPNVGKSTLMKALTAYIIYKELSSGMVTLVMKDNKEVHETVKELIELGFINAVPFLGTQYDKYVKNEIESRSGEQTVLDGILDNSILDFYGPSCRILSLLDPEKGESIERSGELLCNNILLYTKSIYYKNRNESQFDEEEEDDEELYSYNGEIPVRKEPYACPYIFECEKYKSRTSVKNATVLVTNTHSLVQSITNKTIFNQSSVYLEFLLKNSNLIMIDEVDLAKTIASQKFAVEESLIDTNEKSNFEILLEGVEEAYRGKKASDDTISRWLTDARILKGTGEFILDRLVQCNFLTKKEVKRTFTYKTLLYKVINKLLINEELLEYRVKGLDRGGLSEEEFKHKHESELKKEIQSDFKQFHRLISEYESNNITKKQMMDDNKIKEIFKLKDMNEDEFNKEKNKRDLFILYINLITAAKEKKKTEYNEILDEVWEKFIAYYNLNPRKTKVVTHKKIKDRLGVTIITSYFQMMYAQVSYAGEKIAVSLQRIEERSNIRTSYVLQYKGLLPISPNHEQIGLKLNVSGNELQEKHALSLSNYFYVGSYLIEHMNRIYKYLDRTKTAHIVLLSATSYMPDSPKYHVNIMPQYLLENKRREDGSEDIPKLNYKHMPLIGSDGRVLRMSGLDEVYQDGVAAEISKVLCKVDEISGKCKLDTLMNLTKPGRERIALAVGSFAEARKIKENLTLNIQMNPDLAKKYKVCIIESDTDLIAEAQREGEDGIYDKNKLHEFYKDDYNIAIVVVKSIERGINILAPDESGRKVAAFSVAMYLKRPYPIPNDLDDLVSIINMVAMNRYNRRLTPEEVSEYTITKEIAALIKDSNYAENLFYERDYYAYLSDMSRRYLIADMMTLTHQFEGRFTRGNVEATIVFGCGSFFPKYNYSEEDKNDTVSSSMIKGFEAYLDSFILNSEDTIEAKRDKIIMEKLYGYRYKALKNIEFI